MISTNAGSIYQEVVFLDNKGVAEHKVVRQQFKHVESDLFTPKPRLRDEIFK